MPEQTVLPAGYIESLDEKTKQVVITAMLAERQAAHERADSAEFGNLKETISGIKVDLSDDIAQIKTDLSGELAEAKKALAENSADQRKYFITTILLMLGGTAAIAMLYFSHLAH